MSHRPRAALAASALLLVTAWVAFGNRQEVEQSDQLPDAILGTAPPPTGEAVPYFPDDDKVMGYLARPEGPGPFGAVILIHEWNGLVDRIRQVADAIAEEGYVALAADLYSGEIGGTRADNMRLVQRTLKEPETLIANLNAAVAFLRDKPYVTGKIATIGWCFGGGVALTYALDGENHQGTAIFYGRLLDDPERLATLSHEIYGTFAALDSGPSPEQVNAFVAALRGAGIPNDIHIYDGVNHGFWLWVERDPETRSGPALNAWTRLKAYLTRTIGQ